jgi:hypothetical protein
MTGEHLKPDVAQTPEAQEHDSLRLTSSKAQEEILGLQKIRYTQQVSSEFAEGVVR